MPWINNDTEFYYAVKFLEHIEENYERISNPYLPNWQFWRDLKADFDTALEVTGKTRKFIETGLDKRDLTEMQIYLNGEINRKEVK